MRNVPLVVVVVTLHVLVVPTPSTDGFAAAPTPTPTSNDKTRANPPPRQVPDERQFAMMKKLGYEWDGAKRTWFRGNKGAYAKGRATARSGNRFARFVEANDAAGDEDPQSLVPASSPAAVVAARRFEEVLQAAREEALPKKSDESRARDRDIKNVINRPSSPPAWLAIQLAVLASTTFLCRIDWAVELERATIISVLLGLAAGFAVAECRSRLRRCQPGVEEPDGRMERLLADGTDGSIALPAPAHVRYESDNWRAFALVGEVVAAANVATLVNAVAQPAALGAINNALVWRLVDGTSDIAVGQYIAVVGAAGAALVVATPAFLRGISLSSGSLDGVAAEVEAAERAKRGAAAYYNMSPPTEADAMDAAKSLSALAGGWVEKFGESTNGTQWKQPLYAFLGSLACAVAWQLSGGALVAPFLARVVGALDTYAIRYDTEVNRVSVPLPHEREEQRQ